MSQIFHPSANVVAKASIVIGLLTAGGFVAGLTHLNRSPYINRMGEAREQPVPFSHKHHVAGLGIDCRYCHTSVEVSASAGLPATEVCMSCHSQIWADAPMLEPVRASFRNDQSLIWNRVHDLPQFVYFNHSIHVAKGVGCQTCHGQVDQMPLAMSVRTLQMEWCLDCHRQPERYVRPRDQVFNMEWIPPGEQLEMGRKLVAEYKIRKLTDCYTCHR